jgi:branched-chain amino acid transport system ATP-binding protein
VSDAEGAVLGEDEQSGASTSAIDTRDGGGEASEIPDSAAAPDHGDPPAPAVLPERSAPILKLELLHVRYGLVPALRGVSIEVGEGEMVALLGANGAGKTTTLRAISGIVKPHSGRIQFDGRRVDGMAPYRVVGRGIAQMPEGRELFPSLTVMENLRYGYWPNRKDRRGFSTLADQIFEAFPRLRERRRQKAGTLSGGEQQMLTAGIALMSRPRLLLVDELSLGLAPMVISQLFEVLREVNRRGTAVLLVEQFVPLALANTERAYVLAKGEVVMSGRSAELRDNPDLVATYLGGVDVPSEARDPAIQPSS